MDKKPWVGHWWCNSDGSNAIVKQDGTPKAYERSKAETTWIFLSDPTDHCWKKCNSVNEKRIMLTSVDFCNVVNIGLLDDIKPGDVKQIEIFSSGNWVMYD